MMSLVCGCGHQMHRHGSRNVLVTDHQDGTYCEHFARIQRFRCPNCLSTDGIETPEIEQGFKLTKAAADKLVTAALSNDVQACSDASGVDKSTISRLLTSKADAVMLQHRDIKTCRLQLIRPSVLALLDQRHSSTLGFLPGIASNVVENCLERMGVETVIPCPETAPYSFPWIKKMSVTLSGADFAVMLKGLIKNAARKVIEMTKLPESLSPSSALQLLTSDLTTLSVNDNVALSQLAPAGTPARGFMRMRDRLLAVHKASDLTAARAQLEKWKEDCRDLWGIVFSGVVRFLDTYKDMILTNPYALQAAATYSGPPVMRPANVMTLQLHHAGSAYRNQLTLRQ
ncbi:hypothetical protein [Rhizobium sp. MHM7A]|uniref:hypothetical protein n=1 Tax=Rhizobium sp. MHM7A TaxID=2583233 RepID=UPI001107202F|nr:hypothetical protein [Rhizobium sp. MHM7A]TLX16186.1 hypothetical protein FFR93_02340 [Rhizobium sp. MHM7A]